MTRSELLHQRDKFLSQYNWEEIQHRLKTYFKFIVVRDPLKRFLSAYRDKLERHGMEFNAHHTPINKANGITNFKSDRNVSFSESAKYFINVYKESLKLVNNLTLDGINMDMLDPVSQFSNKIKSIINGKRIKRESIIRSIKKINMKGLRLFDVHWARYSSSCHPCLVNYDHIVDLETISDDAILVLRKLGYTGDLRKIFPSLFRHRLKTTSSKEIEYYRQLTLEQIDVLKTIYKNDLKLFGYE